MNDYLTEQEQVELLKKWIKQYSLVILAGVVLAVLIISGWRYWQQRQNTFITNASVLYDQMLTMSVQNNVNDATQNAKELLNNYNKTVYADIAAFTQARNAITHGDKQTAENSLNWVINHSHVPALRQIARIRLARIFIGTKEADKAITLLQKIDDNSFSGMTNEVLGDAYFAMQNYVAARQAYGLALASLPNAEVARPLLQMKYDNLTNGSDTATILLPT